MDIFINDKNIEFQIENEKSVGEILGAIEFECEKAKMTITKICIDGTNIPAENLDHYFAASPNDIQKIELSTISGYDILNQLRILGSRFTSFVPLLQEIAVQLQTGKDMHVMETINSFSLDLQNLYQLLPLLSLTELSTEKVMIDNSHITAYPSELAPVLTELLEALQRKDTVLVGDLSEYELAPRIEKLGAVLSAL